jgi:dGTPase
MRATIEAKQVVRELFDAYLADPGRLPPEWSAGAGLANAAACARLVADYIAGMTDLYAFDAHRRLIGHA